MLTCLIYLIIWCIIAIIVLYIFETVVAMFIALPSQVFVLIRLLVGLLVLLAFLNCVGLLGGAYPLFPHGRVYGP